MIVMGNKVNPCARNGSSRNLAAHLSRTDTNEQVAVQEMRGFASEDLDGAFEEINATAAGVLVTSHPTDPSDTHTFTINAKSGLGMRVELVPDRLA